MKIQSPQDLGLLVRVEREKRNWTQSELGERVGVRRLWISEFEQGKTTAQIGLVFRTLKALGLTVSVGNLKPPGDKGAVVDLGTLVQGMPDEVIASAEETPDAAIRRTRKEQEGKDDE